MRIKWLVLSCLLFTACSKDDIPTPIPQWGPEVQTKTNTIPIIVNKYTISIDSVLTRDGLRSVAKDTKGYYHIKLIPNPQQQSYRVTGRILLNGIIPNKPVEKIEWESNLYWHLNKGDTIATITKSYINYFTGQYTIVNLPALISNVTALVPTTNPASYSDDRTGEINTIISPTGNIIGDTLLLKTYHYESKIILYTKIVLE